MLENPFVHGSSLLGIDPTRKKGKLRREKSILKEPNENQMLSTIPTHEFCGERRFVSCNGRSLEDMAAKLQQMVRTPSGFAIIDTENDIANRFRTKGERYSGKLNSIEDTKLE